MTPQSPKMTVSAFSHRLKRPIFLLASFFLLTSLFLAFPTPLPAEDGKSLEDVLREEGIKPYTVPIHLQNQDWLLQEFGPGDPYPINVSLAAKNMVWQTREQIRRGEIPPAQGIIRTFWYTHLKPVLARTNSLNENVDQSALLHDVLVDLVRTRDIMRYKDMGFLNNNAGSVAIGKNGHVMLIGEKHGKYAVLEQIAKELNCTVFTLGGQPSLLSMEYLVDDYKAKRFDIRQSLYLLFVVDYDPAGWIIRDSVVNDLKFYGMKNIQVFDIILPSILNPDELALARFPIPSSHGTINQNWLKRSGGINGELAGFESDSVPFDRLRQKILDIATPFVGSPENIRRSNAVAELWRSLNYLIQVKLGLDTPS